MGTRFDFLRNSIIDFKEAITEIDHNDSESASSEEAHPVEVAHSEISMTEIEATEASPEVLASESSFRDI